MWPKMLLNNKECHILFKKIKKNNHSTHSSFFIRNVLNWSLKKKHIQNIFKMNSNYDHVGYYILLSFCQILVQQRVHLKNTLNILWKLFSSDEDLIIFTVCPLLFILLDSDLHFFFKYKNSSSNYIKFLHSLK